MAIDYQTLKARAFPEKTQLVSDKDAILYALGLGLGADPMDASQLRFVFEEQPGFAVFPTMAVVLAGPGFWAREPDTGIDWRQVLHGEQGLVIHAPIPVGATVIGRTRIEEIVDKGPGRGALIYMLRELYDQADGTHLATSRMTTFARADGGFGGPSASLHPLPKVPQRAPDATVEIASRPEAALIYRLSGDPNPLHASPEVAAQAGFARPILHGLCSYGIAARAVLDACCDGDPARLKRFDLRFTSPVYPGETIRTEIWREEDRVAFRAVVADRDVTVLDNGLALIA